ncbi:GNAT family N-acetyltransferase [Nocardioides psychrotolerans]|uniref:GNAT family N-acetyltransferase n=1 Tax=Nocardioides psychrotolerans TaxID=1005945 RepID=UPI003137DCFC
MDLRPLDIHDDELMSAVFRVVDRGTSLGREEMPRATEQEWVGAVRAPDSGERAVHVAALVDGKVVGVATAYLFLLDNTDKAWFEVVVDPAHRRAGIGSALVERLTEVATADGRTQLTGGTKIPFDRIDDHPYRAFAEHHGFARSNVEIVRHLALPVPEASLTAWADQAAAASAGYRIETHVGSFPAEHAESLCVLLGQLAVDAPTGDVDYEEEVMTPERLAERYAMSAAMGRETFETIALSPDGVVAAQSTLQVPLDPEQRDAWQWGTFVHREHRGHRLGLAVKTTNLSAVQEQRPHVTRVTTQNGETNGYMISINELIGFRPVEASMEFLKRV